MMLSCRYWGFKWCSFTLLKHILINVLRLGINYIILGKQSESYRRLFNGVMLAAAAWDVLIMQSKQLIESLKENDLADKNENLQITDWLKIIINFNNYF